ncbi:DNA replication protein DnaC [Bradyrhizobium sp. USDA 10063]
MRSYTPTSEVRTTTTKREENADTPHTPLAYPARPYRHGRGLTSLADNEEAHGLAHAEWLALLLDHEATWRNNRRLALRLRKAKLRHHAVPEDIDYRASRGLDRRLFDMLLRGDWIKNHENCAIVGPTGVGKSWLGCALGHKACRENHSVLYTRLPRLFEELDLARGDGRLASRMKSIAAVELLILDLCAARNDVERYRSPRY